MIPIHIIVAIDANRGIGKEGELPWELLGDLKHFRETTTTVRSPKKRNVVVMGRRTWESIPEQFRPLQNRMNIVLTSKRNYSLPEEVMRAEKFSRILDMSHNEQLQRLFETIFIIGGEEVYEEAITHPECEKLWVTHVHGVFECDTFFPVFDTHFKSIKAFEPHTEAGLTYHFEEYLRK